MKLNHLGSLITVGEPGPDGKETCLGYLMNFNGRGIYSPDGKIEITSADAEAHNKALSQAEIDGLDTCEIGQHGTLYWSPSGGIHTWIGTRVTGYDCNRRQTHITFRRNGKVFTGRIQKDSDCFNFRRIK
jgi:hypothetical protein